MSGSEPYSPKGLPRPEDIIRSSGFSDRGSDEFQENLQESFIEDAVRREKQYIELEALNNHYQHKGRWSWFLMLILMAMIGFQCFLLWKVGVGAWDFAKYDWLLPALLVQNLGQIIALAWVVVRSLFR